MDDRQKILDRLKRKEQEIQALEERLRAARTYVQALHDILKLLGEDATATPESRGQPPPETALRVGSSVDLARQAILKQGAAMHINALVEALGKDASRESRISLASSLAAYVRKGEIFTRPAPNTFGLAELGHKTAEEDDGPPAGFGHVAPKVPPKLSPTHHVTPEPKGPRDDDIPLQCDRRQPK
jgi:hypothetical protein